MSWEENYKKDLENINIIVISNNENNTNKNNVYYAESAIDYIKLCKEKGLNKIFISGGSITNNLFMEEKLVDEIILNYNPYVLNEGIPLFRGKYFENKLELIKVIEEQEGIVQVHYKVLK